MSYNSVADIIGLYSFVKPWLPPKVDLDVNRKPMCDFLLVINSNFGPICYRFRDIGA